MKKKKKKKRRQIGNEGVVIQVNTLRLRKQSKRKREMCN
jgi:hypothetical protein